jgi:hypothetical protein
LDPISEKRWGFLFFQSEEDSRGVKMCVLGRNCRMSRICKMDLILSKKEIRADENYECQNLCGGESTPASRRTLLGVFKVD